MARLWPRHREKLMYLIVGSWNTLVGYGVFALLYSLLHDDLGSPIILAIVYAITSVSAFLAMRYLVFEPVAHPVIEYLRYLIVYLPIVVVNMVVLPLALKFSSLNAYVIQAVFVVVVVVAGYLGNKYFAFRKHGGAV